MFVDDVRRGLATPLGYPGNEEFVGRWKEGMWGSGE